MTANQTPGIVVSGHGVIWYDITSDWVGSDRIFLVIKSPPVRIFLLYVICRIHRTIFVVVFYYHEAFFYDRSGLSFLY